jgi:hypothetical protein
MPGACSGSSSIRAATPRRSTSSAGSAVCRHRSHRRPSWVAAPAAIAAYLGAYGPSTPEVFDTWLLRNALKKATLRGWFAGMGDQLTKVDVEGQEAYILSEHADDLARTRASRSVRLLGAFDQYVLGPGTGDPQILPAEHRAMGQPPDQLRLWHFVAPCCRPGREHRREGSDPAVRPGGRARGIGRGDRDAVTLPAPARSTASAGAPVRPARAAPRHQWRREGR